MPTAFRLVLLLSLPAGMVLAQRQTPYKGHGYVFLSPGVTSPDGGGFMHFGGGGEGVFYKGVGAGGEIGYAYPTSAFGCGIGLASVNGLFQFGEARPDRKVVPFATAGYSLAFRGDTARFVNFGGGATWWFRERTGLRLEFRDHTTDGVHLIGFRIGVSFR